ncbi:hypothetical protein [Nonlabens agnitus]|uniref:Uncharacterized protein n=1 Tax=Nonlabens agnitus TaxID=870484 RepID=A0A2S9WVK7_9FLAO|nr:hypothetical protein [Nonlabens agnitus]PRP67471.1 hypothetical protein BST86_10385 [Nonlabens agnitus]
MMYRLFFFIALVASCESDEKTAQAIIEPVFKIDQIATLDSSITESSGIVAIDDLLYTHSDIRGKAELIQILKDGSISSTTTYQNIDIRDWEDITIDEEFLYIGDIGNNLGNKTDLKIFKIKRADLNNTNPTVETITFSFADQTNFDNTELNQTSYDLEALVAIDNDLYILTKDWLNLNSNIYKLNKEPGTYALQPLATLNVGGLVTGATSSPEGDIIITGYSPTLSPFVGRVNIQGETPVLERKINLTSMLANASQIEGITYFGMIDNVATYYLTSEQFTRSFAGNQIVLPAHLYELKWNE